MFADSRSPGRRSRASRAAALSLLSLGALAAVAANAAADPAVADPGLEPVLVSGERPGPGLWQVSGGGHTLWIVGTLRPFPRAVRWRTRELEAVMSRAEAVIEPPSAELRVGLWRGLTLLPAALRARRLTDHRTLKDVLPADVYGHFSALKALYLPADRDVETLRPVFAAQRLTEAAVKQAGLTTEDVAWDTVRELAGRHHVPRVPVAIDLPLADPRAALDQWAALPADAEVGCLSAMLARLEDDLGQMRHRADLWAVGDIPGLRAVPPVERDAACFGFLDGIAALRDPVQQIRARMREIWVAAATTALAARGTSVAVLPIEQLTAADGVLTDLAARGYAVSEPR